MIRGRTETRMAAQSPAWPHRAPHGLIDGTAWPHRRDCMASSTGSLGLIDGFTGPHRRVHWAQAPGPCTGLQYGPCTGLQYGPCTGLLGVVHHGGLTAVHDGDTVHGAHDQIDGFDGLSVYGWDSLEARTGKSWGERTARSDEPSQD